MTVVNTFCSLRTAKNAHEGGQRRGTPLDYEGHDAFPHNGGVKW